MDDLVFEFFPFPRVQGGERFDGALIDWPDRCNTCNRECEGAASGELGLCSYGLNYYRVEDDLLISGLVVSDYPGQTPARQKMFRELRNVAVSRADVERVVARCETAVEGVRAALRAEMQKLIDEWRDTQTYQQEVVNRLRPDLEKALSQVHDYKQFVQTIVQNLDVALETKFSGLELDEKLERASHEERAIYWAAIIMDEKLDAALFLDSPERIHATEEKAQARLHGMVTKYARIYRNQAERKGVSLDVNGVSYGTVYGNQRALGIIPHTLIDNAVKYAPSGTAVDVLFEESVDEIVLSVGSYGPQILPEEEKQIFDLFFRGQAARERSSEGTGFGLASAQNVASAHGMRIEVEQVGDDVGPEETRRTTFQVRFPRAHDDARLPTSADPPDRPRRKRERVRLKDLERR